MTRFVLWTIAGILLGLIVHLVTLLALPSFASRTASQRLATLGGEAAFHASPGDGSVLPYPDPAMRVSVCRYDLAKGPLHVQVALPESFLSVSFYTPDGLSFYALNDRAGSEGRIDLTLYTSLQLADVRTREGPDSPSALRIEAPEPRGLVVLRALVPFPSAEAQIEETLRRASCTQMPAAGTS